MNKKCGCICSNYNDEDDNSLINCELQKFFNKQRKIADEKERKIKESIKTNKEFIKTNEKINQYDKDITILLIDEQRIGIEQEEINEAICQILSKNHDQFRDKAIECLKKEVNATEEDIKQYLNKQNQRYAEDLIEIQSKISELYNSKYKELEEKRECLIQDFNNIKEEINSIINNLINE